MNSYGFVKFLGQGSYGEVQLVKHSLEEKEVREPPSVGTTSRGPPTGAATL